MVRARRSFDVTDERLTTPMGPDRWLSSTGESSWWTFGPTSQPETEPTFPNILSPACPDYTRRLGTGTSIQ